MDHRTHIRFLLNGRDVTLSEVGAEDTLLDFIRLDRRLTGTKEGCAEGDCGACTVLVGRLSNGALLYETVNACIRLLASVDGCHVVTIEHLSGPEDALHPVQQAMVDHHASQCGFCTPGIVMSLYGLWMAVPQPSEAEIETALQGNLCRCTGYAPIIRAAQAAGRAPDPLEEERGSVTARLSALRDGRRVEVRKGESHAILPADVDDLADTLTAHPDATIVAGATDVALWVTKGLRRLSPAVFTAHLDGLRRVEAEDNGLRIGAGVSYSEAEVALVGMYPHLSGYWARIGGVQVRNMGTIGGNIANGSPIGDTPPVLIALGAEVVLRKGPDRRSLPLEAYFLDYGKQDRAPGEFLESIFVPPPAAHTRHAAYKLSKRRDEDISSVAVGIAVKVDGDRITAARIACGGMAAIPKRAAAAETALVGQPWAATSFERAAEVLSQDLAPLTDWRATAGYRMRAAQNLLRRFWLEQGEGAQIRLERA